MDADLTAEEVQAVARLYGAQEMMLVNILPEHAPRVRSYRLVAEAFGLTSEQLAA